MRHFGHLAPDVRAALFHQEPAEFGTGSPVRVLSLALGATLYSPATRPRLAADVLKQIGHGVVSMVLCLEDAIDDCEVEAAETNLVGQLTELALGDADRLPLLFVRVRTPEQIGSLVRRLGPAVDVLSGFVLPKFTEESGVPFLEALMAAEQACGRRLLAMPVLESPRLLYLESRGETLRGIARTVDKYRDRVLAIRLGVTDFCSAYGLRRTPEMTAYDVGIVASVIADVVNLLGRADGSGSPYRPGLGVLPAAGTDVQPTQLRRTPFTPNAEKLRAALIEHDLDGLLREVELDRANGLLGKTCIHPSHVAAGARGVRRLARGVLRRRRHPARRPQRRGRAALGVHQQDERGEAAPRLGGRTMRRAEVFGVAREEITFVELLAAHSGAMSPTASGVLGMPSAGLGEGLGSSPSSVSLSGVLGAPSPSGTFA